MGPSGDGSFVPERRRASAPIDSVEPEPRDEASVPARPPSVPPGTVPGVFGSPGPPPSRNLLFLALVAVLLVAAMYFGALFVLGFPPFPSRTTPATSTGPAPEAFSVASEAANRTAGSEGAGPWTAELAIGFGSPAATVLSTNLTGLLSAALGIDCPTVSLSGSTSITVPGSSVNASDGEFPDWIFFLANSSEVGAVVLIVSGASEPVALVAGCSSSLAYFAGIPPTASDSPAAVASAESYYGYAFERLHPGGILSATVVSGSTPLYLNVPGYWEVDYTTCPVAGSAALSGYEFSAKISLLQGQVFSVPHNGSVPCGSSSAFSFVHPIYPPAGSLNAARSGVFERARLEI